MRIEEGPGGEVACWLNCPKVTVALLDAAGKTGRWAATHVIALHLVGG